MFHLLAGLRVVNSVEVRTVEMRRVEARKVGCLGWALATGMMAAVMTKTPREATRVERPRSRF